jgi:Zn-dependent M28 family amino/carboxypeptidase
MPRLPTGPLLLLFACLAFTDRAAGQDRTRLDQGDQVVRALTSIRAAHLRAHIELLADDMLEGRAPASRGGDFAARYIATRFQRMGLAPLYQGFLQPVPLARWRPHADSMHAELTTFGGRIPLDYPSDIALWTESAAGHAVADAELVFAGYGIVAPEYGWDDYAGTDVRGKAVLVLIGEPDAPPHSPGLFDGPEMTVYARWTYKVEEAGRQGAAAVLLAHTTASSGYGWDVVRASWTSDRFSLRSAANAAPLPPVMAWIRGDILRTVLAAANRDPGNLAISADRPGFRAHSLGLDFRARVAGTRTAVESPNVIATLPGSHATRRAQTVVFTAHYDHLGIGPAIAGDSIYNGAYDNAGGVAALLEIAEAFSQLATPPERTLVFIATTAEEAGLLGASFYNRQHPDPFRLTVAAINIDGLNLWGETHDAIALGANRSSLGDIVQRRARELGMYVTPDPAPETGLIFRTDQAAFARLGIPSIGLMHGFNFRGQPPGWGETFLTRWQTNNYHRPSDEFDATADLAGALQQTRLAFLVGLDAASGPRPTSFRPLTLDR